MKKIAGLALAFTAILAGASQSSHAQTKRALLVHVSQYKDAKNVPTLGNAGNAQNDIPKMDEVLTTKFGFKTQKLDNGQASRQEVMKALEDLANTAKPDDVIVFYFSGHGAHTDKLFSLCPWDAQSQSGENDITEGDLQRWLDKLKARNVTLILDCCFSRLGARGVAPKLHSKFMGRSNGDLIRDFEQVQIPAERAVILSAASQNGVALQAQLYDDNAWIGLFSFFLVKEMKKAVPQTTFHNLMDDVKQDVQARLRTMSGGQGYMQTPALYGSDALINRPLFAPVAGAAAPPPPETPAPKPYSTIKQADAKQVVIPVGKEEGVTKGSEFAVYPKNETQFKDKQHEIGKVKVVEVKDNEAIAVPLPGTDPKRIPTDGRATMTRFQNDVNEDSSVLIQLDGDAAFQTQMKSALSRMSFVKIVNDPKTLPHLVIRGSVGADGVQAQLYDPDGKSPLDPNTKSVTGRDAAELVGKMTPLINKLAVLRTLIHLKNPNPDFHVTLTSGMREYVEGEKATFTCKTDRDCYIILYTIDAFGYPDLLYPSRAGEANLLRAGTTLPLPPKEANGDGKIGSYTIEPPYGKTTVFALAITDKAMADSLKKRLLESQQTDTPDRGGTRAIRARETIQDLQTVPLDTWSVTSLDVQTLSKDEAAPGGNKQARAGGN